MAELVTNSSMPEISDAHYPTPSQYKTKAPAESVDIIRGFALFGILFINIMTFRSSQNGWTGLDHLVDTLSLILAQGKFVTTFMILFGLSFTFQSENAASNHFTGQYVRRMGMLFVLGVLHFVLLWEGDILMGYVVPGALLLFFAHSQSRTLLISSGGFYGLLLAFVLIVAIGSVGQPTASHDPTIAPTLYQHGSYGELVKARLELLPDFLGEHFIGSVLLLGTFLLGAYIGKRGYLSHPQEHLPLLRRVFIGGLLLGIPANTVSQLGQPYRDTLALPQQIILHLAIFFSPTILSLAYIAGVALLAGSVKYMKPLAAVGRMTLTNYLMQSLILTTIFYNYGLGLYDKIGPALGILLISGLFAVQILFSVLWTKRFHYGLVEWLWRSVTYWRFEPLRKQTVTVES